MNSFTKIIEDLQTRYDTVGPYYLSDFYTPGGSERFYDFLSSVYKSEYKPNFRILIAQDCADTYKYDDLPGDAIVALQKYLSQIDISNFFVMVITGNKNINQELSQVQKLYSTDSVQIQSQIVDIEYVKPVVPVRDTFCILPWMHLYVGPDSNVLPCCVANQQFPMGSINDQSIDSILKSPKFNLLRKNMLDGKRSKECNRCYLQEDAGLKSVRQISNDLWRHKKINFVPDGSIEKFSPTYLDIRLNNICNLKCRMCSGYFSSAIAQEESKLFGKSSLLDSLMDSEQRVTAFNDIINYLPHAEKIYFAGGEPLLAPEHYKILDVLIDSKNVDLEIIYNTNFTSLTYKDVSVLDLWGKFSNITIMASLDAIGDVAEYVRHGTKWDVIESNLEKLKLQCPHVNFTVSSTVGFLNISSLIELQQQWHTNKILDISKFKLSIMVGPEHLTVCVLPAHHKARIATLINNHIDWCHEQNASNLAGQWKNLLTYMESKNLSNLLPEFRRLTTSMDQYRKESFITTFPEYQDLLP